MGKNRVAPQKRRDTFFAKSKTGFKAKHKTVGDSFKPSSSAPNDFFVKPVAVASKAVQDSKEPLKEKKPFDKKTWRLQKYSKKYKLQQWEDKRKKAVLRGYYRNLKEDEPKLDVQKIYAEHKSDDDDDDGGDGGDEDRINEENENNLNTNVDAEIPAHTSTQKKNKAFKKAHLEFERIKNEKTKKKDEALKRKEEKAQALEEYKKKKTEKFKRLNKKTKKGQPIMKDRLEMLLERIQKSVDDN